ncbi:unnamed protein product, partial [Brassica rapa]
FLIKWYSSSTNLKIWKTSGTTYLLVVWKSSGLLGSLLTKKSSGLPGSRLDFQEVVFQIWKTSGTTYLLVVWKSSGSRLDFLESSWTSVKSSWKSSELPKVFRQSRRTSPEVALDFLKVVWTSWKSSDKVFFHIKWNPSLSL